MVLLICLMAVTGPAYASESSPWADEETYCEQSFHKLIFGATNLLGGWTEIITVPIEYDKEGKTVIEGVAQGLYNAAVYTIGGALHTGTFFLPQIDVPLPDDGVHL